MPVARIITRTPAESEELRRQLTAAGYSVKFTAPEEEFDDADLVVAAANVHSDYALRYASEVAAEADADIVVAPGVVAAAPGRPTAAVPDEHPSEIRHIDERADAPSAPAILLGSDTAMAADKQERGPGIAARAAMAWQQFREKRALAAEEKRLAQERREQERQERERVLREQRAAAEARMVAERERLRVERAAEEERLRKEQEAVRAREMERVRAEAEQQRARMAAEAEHARMEQERARREEEQHRALEAEQARMAAEQARMRAERERAAREEQERIARDAALVAAAHEVPVPTPITPAKPYVPVSPAAPAIAPSPTIAPAPVVGDRQLGRPAVHVRRKPARRAYGRQQKFQRAALVASLVALAAMIALAVALNVHPSSPMPASVTNNPVQEQSPFGAASVGAPVGQAKQPVASAQTQAARTVQTRPHASLPQNDSSAVPTKPPASKARHVRRHTDDVADDEVVIHHFGSQQPQPKRPPATQQRAGVPRYTDE